MRRKPKTWLDTVKRFTPWLWRECDSCGYEFRFEPGYKAKKSLAIGVYINYYLCSKCAPDLKTAKSLFQKIFEIPARPAPPPIEEWMSTQPKRKTHFMIDCRKHPPAKNPYQYRWLSACGQVGDHVKTRKHRKLITVNCGNCVRLLKGKPPAFKGKMVMLIESKPKPEAEETKNNLHGEWTVCWREKNSNRPTK